MTHLIRFARSTDSQTASKPVTKAVRRTALLGAVVLFGSLELLSPSVWASQAQSAPAEVIGSVVILKGRVSRKSGSGPVAWLREADKIGARDVIATLADGKVKILLKDESQLSLGPDSQVRMDSLSSGVGNVSLLKGNIRTKVMKNYLQAANAPKIKFFLKTKGAVMGVRGTDFQVIYNPENQVTSLVTFEGSVAMTKLERGQEMSSANMTIMARMLESDRAVVVTQGNFSSARPDLSSVTIPTKISPAQFEILKNTDPLAKAPATGQGDPKTARNYLPPVPAGVDPKTFTTSEKDLAKGLGVTDRSIASTSAKSELAPPPEGLNSRSGSYAPAAGGYIDLKTGLYIPPTAGSAYDANTGVYIPTASKGAIDLKTGEYVAPSGLKLDATKGFILATEYNSGRNIASTVPSSAPTTALAQATAGLANLNPSATTQSLDNGSTPGVSYYRPGDSSLIATTNGTVVASSSNPVAIPVNLPPVIPATVAPPAYVPQGPTSSDPFCPSCPLPTTTTPTVVQTRTKVNFSFSVQ